MKKSIFKRSIILLSVITVMLALMFATACSCGGEDDPGGVDPGEDEKEIVSVAITRDGEDAGSSIDVDYTEGITIQLGAKVEQKGGLSESVRWTSSDTEVVSVDRTGKLSFGGVRGSAIITATASADTSKSDTLVVNVNVPVVAALTIDKLGSVRFEAENADIQGADAGDTGSLTGSVVEDNENASGGKNIGNLTAVGNQIIFAVASNAAAKTRLTFCMANPSSDYDNIIALDEVADITWNDEELTTGISVYSDRSDVKPWFDYKEYVCETDVELKEGLNTLVFEVLYNANNDAYDTWMPNFDYIDFDVYEYGDDRLVSEVTSVTMTDGDAAAQDSYSITYYEGLTRQFGANVVVSGLASDDVIWTTSDPEVAEVDQTGKVTLLGKAGEAVITVRSAEDESKTDSTTITVSVPTGEVSAVTITKDGEDAGDRIETECVKDATVQLGVTVTHTGDVSEEVQWSSGNGVVATVDGSGKVTLTGVVGEAVITVVSAADATKSDSVNIVVSMPEQTVTDNGTYRIEGEAADMNDSVPGEWGPLVETPVLPDGVELSGGQNLGNMNTAGNRFTYTLESNGSGKVALTFRFARKDGDAEVRIDEAASFTFNGADFDTGIIVPVADEESGLQSWFQYDEYECTATLDLRRGVNTLEMVILNNESDTDVSQLPNVDYIEFTVTEFDGSIPDGEITSVTMKDGEEAASENYTIVYAEGLTKQLGVDVVKTGNMTGDVMWESSDTSVATVDNTGKVTFTGKTGETVITVMSLDDRSKSDSTVITVEKAYAPIATIDKTGNFKIEAELADISDCVVAPGADQGAALVESPNNEAVSGQNLANLNAMGNRVVFAVQSDAAATATLSLRLAPGTATYGEDRSFSLDDVAKFSINGVEFKTGITINITSDRPWFDYVTYTCEVPIELADGLNLLTIDMLVDMSAQHEANTNALMPNVDYIELNVTEYVAE